MSAATMTSLLTVGHSNHAPEDFLALLEGAGVELLVDVRRYPGSRRHPHFARDALRAALAERGIAYRHAPELGGHREPAGPSDGPERNGAWKEDAFRGYADHMATGGFRGGVERLLVEAAERRTTVMCAEEDPARCHRRLLADFLAAGGTTVEHLRKDGSRAPHVLDPRARVLAPQEGGGVVYPAEGGQLGLFGD